MFEVTIESLKINTKIGVSHEERKKEQKLLVTLKFSYNNNKNLDDINNLKDYSKIIKFLKKFISSSRYKTIEKLITETTKEIRKKFKIKKIFLKIEKPEIAKKYECRSLSVSK